MKEIPKVELRLEHEEQVDGLKIKVIADIKDAMAALKEIEEQANRTADAMERVNHPGLWNQVQALRQEVDSLKRVIDMASRTRGAHYQ